ncbi:sulfite exporter TauE/SafE family protein [bacterium]|nr:sulfite exporter TauE/SafE family protein [bacterium]
MIVLGYLGALIIGIVLGLIGGGGSILTVPIFVYLLDVNPILATAYSLFVVGVTALAGAIRNFQNNQIDFKTGIIFAIPAFLGVYIARAYLLDLIPNQILFFSLAIQKETVIMIFFAFIMLIASYFMIRGHKEDDGSIVINYSNLILTFEGFIVGVLTGIVGAGGGFLIIPALILFAKLPMKKAVATSLMIIAIKSLFGFVGDLGNSNLIFDWGLLFLFSILSICGIFIGVYMTKFVQN